jgi:hypothetical protein
MITAINLTDTNHTDVFVSSGENGITTLMICNHSGSTDAVVDAWVIPSNQSRSNANQILKSLTIVASDTFVMDMEKLILGNGDKIVLKANASDIVNSVISSMAVA